jgi:hypothetical protein
MLDEISMHRQAYLCFKSFAVVVAKLFPNFSALVSLLADFFRECGCLRPQVVRM